MKCFDLTIFLLTFFSHGLFTFLMKMTAFCLQLCKLDMDHFPHSRQVLDKAKEIVEKTYSVVGVLEDLDSTFKALEAFVPKFFRNARELFNENIHNLTLTHANQNPFKKPMKNETRDFLQSKFSVEIEFYEFCKQRLYNQVQSLPKMQHKIYFWPDQLAFNQIDPVDDYVLL